MVCLMCFSLSGEFYIFCWTSISEFRNGKVLKNVSLSKATTFIALYIELFDQVECATKGIKLITLPFSVAIDLQESYSFAKIPSSATVSP